MGKTKTKPFYIQQTKTLGVKLNYCLIGKYIISILNEQVVVDVQHRVIITNRVVSDGADGELKISNEW